MTNPSIPMCPPTGLERIKQEPTKTDQINILGSGPIHESCFKSYSTLTLVKEMIERGDSKETILIILHYLGY